MKKMKKNPKIFMDIGTKNGKLGRIIFELFEDIVPRTVTNFVELIKKDKGHGYIGSNFHRIIPKFMIQGGDFTRGDGTGGHSIYGEYFEDECFDLKHNKVGLLSMANSGPDTNGSQFFITLEYSPHLDGKHVVFGQISNEKNKGENGINILKKIESFGSESGKPSEKIKIINCGILS